MAALMLLYSMENIIGNTGFFKGHGRKYKDFRGEKYRLAALIGWPFPLLAAL